MMCRFLKFPVYVARPAGNVGYCIRALLLPHKCKAMDLAIPINNYKVTYTHNLYVIIQHSQKENSHHNLSIEQKNQESYFGYIYSSMYVAKEICMTRFLKKQNASRSSRTYLGAIPCLGRCPPCSSPNLKLNNTQNQCTGKQ